MNQYNNKLTPDIAPTVIDLFAGSGGLSLGLEQAGFFPLFVNELNNDAMETYLINRDDEYSHLRENFNINDIKDAVSNEKFFFDLKGKLKDQFGIDYQKHDIDLVVGGPPCQGFSGIGIRRSYSVDKKQLPSNHLYQDMAYFVQNIRPKMFLFENVEGLLRSRWTNEGERGEIFKDVLKTFRSIPDYQIKYRLVFAKDYGVPQNRPRVILIGVRSDIANLNHESMDALEAGLLPNPTNDYPTLPELLNDLIDPNFEYGGSTNVYVNSTQNEWQKRMRTKPDGTLMKKGSLLTDQEYSKHSNIVQERFTAMIEGDGKIPEHLKTKKFSQRVLPKTWNGSGPTLTACSMPDDFVHYSQARTPTVREMARIQTFPDWYKFAGKRTTGGLRRAGNPRENLFDREVPKYTQIGNAVPVKMAYEIGKHLKSILPD